MSRRADKSRAFGLRPNAAAFACSTALALCASSAYADAGFRPYPYGAPGDAGTTEQCLDGYYIVGLHGSRGSWINKLGLICARVSPARRLGPDVLLPMFGSRPGGDDHTYKCGTNEVVVGLYVSATETKKQVATLTMVCASIDGPPNPQLVNGPLGSGERNDKHILGLDTGANFNNQVCGRGDAGYAIALRYGKDVNAVGLVCRPFATAQQSTNIPAGPSLPPQRGAPPAAGNPANTSGTSTAAVPGRLADVQHASTVYRTHTGSSQAGNVACAVATGDVVTVDVNGPDKWVHLLHIQNAACGGQSGWLWNDGDLRIR